MDRVTYTGTVIWGTGIMTGTVTGTERTGQKGKDRGREEHGVGDCDRDRGNATGTGKE